MPDLYVQPHQSQYQAGASTITRRAGCTWASGANGVAAVTGGAKQPTPDAIHALVPRAEEQFPATPGWSLPDLAKATGRIGVAFVVRSGDGWDAFIDALETGHYTVLQGDSDQFDGTSCSGAFDGDHAIGVHAKHKVELEVRWWWTDDPICSTGRWEREDVLRRYAEDLSPTIRFGVFAQAVPAVAPPLPPAKPVVLRFGARKLAKPVAKRIRVPKGRKANVRTAPRTNARITSHLASGSTFGAWQVTTKGQELAGSSRWFGNRTGSRWVHSSSF